MTAARALLLAAASAGLLGAAADPLVGRIAGAPVDCVRLNRNTTPEIVDARTVLYRETDRRVWRTGPVGVCPALRPQGTLIVEVLGARQCRGDRFRVLVNSSNLPSGVCRFDRFTPYDKPAR